MQCCNWSWFCSSVENFVSTWISMSPQYYSYYLLELNRAKYHEQGLHFEELGAAFDLLVKILVRLQKPGHFLCSVM